MKILFTYTAAVLAFIMVPLTASAAGKQKVVPIEKEKGGYSLPITEGERKLPASGERVNLPKEGISGPAFLKKKDPLVVVDTPRGGEVSYSCQKVTGRVGGGIEKAFLRINEDNQVVSVYGGKFEAYGALRPGLNTITVLAWDLDGNLGKDSVRVIMEPDKKGPSVEVVSPKTGTRYDITEDRVITVEARASDAAVKDGYLVLNNIPRRVAFKDGFTKQEVALLPGRNEIYVEATGKDGRAGRSTVVKLDTFDARPKDLAAVLTWDSAVADFDLHVWDSFGHHTFNEAKDPCASEAAIPGGLLDMDRKGGYGPEVFSLESAEPEVYTFYATYNPGLKEDGGGKAYLRILLYGDEPSRRILRGVGPVRMGRDRAVWEAAHVKMPEGVFFQEKDTDLAKTFRMDAKAVDRLALMLKEENPSFRLLAISAMGQIKSEDAVGPLMSALYDPDVETRRAAAGALWGIKSLKSVAALIKALKDEDADVRRASAGALGSIGDKEPLYPLTGLLSEEGDPMVRVEAIRALGKIGDPRAYDSLASQAKDPDPRVRVEAMRAMGNLGEPKAVSLLKRALEDKVGGVRELAVWALGRSGDRSVSKTLTDVLAFDADERVRIQAAVALGGLKDAGTEAELEKAATKDSSERVRFMAGRALERMTPPKEKAVELPPVKLDDDVVIY